MRLHFGIRSIGPAPLNLRPRPEIPIRVDNEMLHLAVASRFEPGDWTPADCLGNQDGMLAVRGDGFAGWERSGGCAPGLSVLRCARPRDRRNGQILKVYLRGKRLNAEIRPPLPVDSKHSKHLVVPQLG